MDLYLIQRDDRSVNWDEHAGFVVRATSPVAARLMVTQKARREFGGFASDEPEEIWLDPENSALTLLAEDVEGEPAIILSDFKAG